MVWCGVVWCGVVWCGVVWCDGWCCKVLVWLLNSNRICLDKVKDSKLLKEDLSIGMRHHLLKSSNLDAITNVLRLNGLFFSFVLCLFLKFDSLKMTASL